MKLKQLFLVRHKIRKKFRANKKSANKTATIAMDSKPKR
jgi:hypothetical protein